ncbi:thymidylate synthase [Microbacterium Phage DirtyBubble]|uniref:thymidylate synthase n=1 Tax=Microbacterium Phage DirtyBubble TaxID=2590932 RepID=UPI00118C8D47|nr:thymidylate synthase [Microbacterium Phage DirtyBubble]QDP45076.1 thymidylate synthase [Microbacterium Phage DirtyBubble]QTF81992.1 thymidylate synthase [Microbacterium phage BabyYoda]
MPQTFTELLSRILDEGERRTDRTGTGTLSLFAPDPLRYDLRDDRVALITSKKVPWKMALREFMWMLTGSTNVNHLRQWSPAMAGIWDSWANSDGDIGPTYGAQYRDAGGTLLQGQVDWLPGVTINSDRSHGVDQVREVVTRLLDAPDSRRALISLWSVPELRDMAIEPCMVVIQFSLRGPGYDQLHVHVYQRSADMMLGVPFDLFQASVLAHLVARELSILRGGTPVRAASLTWSAGDVHVYANQIAAAREQLVQAESSGPMSAKIVIDPFPSLRLLDSSLEPSHIDIIDYHPAPAIDAGKPAV